MVESTARRERVEPQPAAASTYLWEVSQKPVSVRLGFDFVDRLEREVLENFRSITSRGSEIGGLLLGAVTPGSPLCVWVEDFEAIPSDYSRGPLYRLSDAELGRFERAIEARASAAEPVVVGFFRAHTRKGIALDEEDLAFLDARFREPHHIALLIRPFATKASVAGIFIREAGAIHGQASYQEFPFRTSQLTPSTRVPVAAPISRSAATPVAPAAVAVNPPVAQATSRPSARAQIVPIARRETLPPPSEPVLADPPKATLAEIEPQEAPPAAETTIFSPPAKPAATKAAPDAWESRPVVAATLFAEKPSPEAARGGRIAMLALGLLIAVAAFVPLYIYPGYFAHNHRPVAGAEDSSTLTLRVEPSGTDLLLTWNKNAAAIRNATKGVLSITDGGRHEDYPMSVSELLTGSIIYSPGSPDVSFQMEVTGRDETKTTAESVRSLRPVRPSPMPGTAAAVQPGALPATTSPGPADAANPLPPGSPTEDAKPLQTPVKPFNADSLVQRLRPATSGEAAVTDLATPPAADPALPRTGAPADMPAGFASPSIAPPPAPAPAPAASKALGPSGGKINPAELVWKKDPEYPALARQARVKGQVTVLALIGADGRVKKVTAVTGHPLLLKAATVAVMQWVFKPTLLNGKPVENESKITLTFGQ